MSLFVIKIFTIGLPLFMIWLFVREYLDYRRAKKSDKSQYPLPMFIIRMTGGILASIVFSFFLLYPLWRALLLGDAPRSYDIGDGLALEHIPPVFRTITDNTRCEQLLNLIELGGTLATSETKTETVIIQEGSLEVKVTPISYNKDGSVKSAARVGFRRIPSVSKQVTYPSVKTPSWDVQRKSGVKCRPITRRVIWTPAAYKIKDKSGATIKYFETAEALAEYINSK